MGRTMRKSILNHKKDHLKIKEL